MSGSLKILKKWLNMCKGDSVFHMHQCEGKFYKKGEISGYYSDLRHKVKGTLTDKNGVPYNILNNDNIVYFPISIFQYGLGAYDLYLETKNPSYLSCFFNVVNWATGSQNVNGSWTTFEWLPDNSRVSSMAQSEGVSLLCRAYKETSDKKYIDLALKAIKFMLKSTKLGGTTSYFNDYITFEENSDTHTILNGMIFSIWGLYDISILSNDKELKSILEMSVNSLKLLLPKYDCGYWSNYDLDGHIASPFYHDLHIEQLKVMYEIFGINEFKTFCEKWQDYQSSIIKPRIAFVVKAIQKLRKINDSVEIVK